MRVLYSYPLKLGATRICYTAWQQVNGLAAAGAHVDVHAGVLHRALPPEVEVHTTLSRGSVRLPYKLLGTLRTFAIHDAIVARRLRKLSGKVDVIHTWPNAAAQTLRVAAQLGIPTVLERPNTHTRYAYEVTQKEADRIGVGLPKDNEYAFKSDVLRREEEEYRLADFLLCPSDFVQKTFMDRGFSKDKLLRHQYGYDPTAYHPPALGSVRNGEGPGLTMIFVGDCAVRKGLHFALEAWLKSTACETGEFLIAGKFLPAYQEKLAPLLAHPSVKVLGFRSDVPELMRKSDILVLPSLEEGSALVTSDARGSGCVILVSEASGAVCQDGVNALVHAIGDVPGLAEHISRLDKDRALLERLREASLATIDAINWQAAGAKLLNVYEQAVEIKAHRKVATVA